MAKGKKKAAKVAAMKKGAAPKAPAKAAPKGMASKLRSAGKAVARAAKAVKKTVNKTVKQAAAKAKSTLQKAAGAAAAIPQPGQGSVCHVEFYAPDVEAAKSFWESLLGLGFHPMGPNEYYFHGKTGWGPGGCLIKGEPNCTAQPAIYWQVDDIPATLARAVELGATQVRAKTEIGGNHGFFAHFRTAEGNLFGVWSRS